jgi:hypothetical protein
MVEGGQVIPHHRDPVNARYFAAIGRESPGSGEDLSPG